VAGLALVLYTVFHPGLRRARVAREAEETPEPAQATTEVRAAVLSPERQLAAAVDRRRRRARRRHAARRAPRRPG
jgi:hypothetical protein